MTGHPCTSKLKCRIKVKARGAATAKRVKRVGDSVKSTIVLGLALKRDLSTSLALGLQHGKRIAGQHQCSAAQRQAERTGISDFALQQLPLNQM